MVLATLIHLLCSVALYHDKSYYIIISKNFGRKSQMNHTDINLTKTDGFILLRNLCGGVLLKNFYNTTAKQTETVFGLTRRGILLWESTHIPWLLLIYRAELLYLTLQLYAEGEVSEATQPRGRLLCRTMGATGSWAGRVVRFSPYSIVLL